MCRRQTVERTSFSFSQSTVKRRVIIIDGASCHSAGNRSSRADLHMHTRSAAQTDTFSATLTDRISCAAKRFQRMSQCNLGTRTSSTRRSVSTLENDSSCMLAQLKTRPPARRKHSKVIVIFIDFIALSCDNRYCSSALLLASSLLFVCF